MNVRVLRIAMVCTVGVAALSASMANAQAAPAAAPIADGRAKADAPDPGDIIVTARRRAEGLMSVPVTVSALSAKDITRYNAANLSQIGDLTPTVIIASYKAASGGSLAIRGISSPATQVGFEQAVSVSVDGVQTSNGRVGTLGFFDLQQVEVMKGPQALFFGKNSSAGVISLTSAGPTQHFEWGGRLGYEFIGDEATAETYVAGPLTNTLGGRIAVRYRHLTGWLYNDAQPIANPFYNPASPAGAAQLPGAHHRRLGDQDFLGRVTLQYDPSSTFRASLKLFGSHEIDDGNGSAFQNIGPCPSGQPKVYGIADPFSECKRDNHTSIGDLPPVIAATTANGQADGIATGYTDVIFSTLNMNLDIAGMKLASTTGYSWMHNYSFSGLDSSVYSQLTAMEENTDRGISQEFRLTGDILPNLGFMTGVYGQKTKLDFFNGDIFRDDTGFNPATGRYEGWSASAVLHGSTVSAFAELQWKIVPKVELSGGLRWTHERRRFSKQNQYGTGIYAVSGLTFPGSTDPRPGFIGAKFSDTNLSPQVTLTYHPDRDSTLYAAYKTGFKSGGFGLTTPLTNTSTISDFDFNSETAKGFEVGAKGEFFGRKLRVTSALFAYKFRNLQVTTFDASTVSFKINNAGAVVQKGGEIEGQYSFSKSFSLHGALTYVHNRFRDYVGQCYGYTIPVAQALTAAAPPGCSFALNAAGGRLLTASGSAILQQDFAGRAPPRSPDWAASTGFLLNRPIRDGLNIELSGDAFYSGHYFAGDTQAPSTVQNSFWRFNSSVRLIGRDERWTVSLIGRNLTNKYYLLFAGDRTGGTSVPLTIGEQRGVVSRGREVALQLNWKLN